jgi:hypothetical protein
MLVVDMLNILFMLFYILAHDYLLVVSVWSICEVDSLLFSQVLI